MANRHIGFLRFMLALDSTVGDRGLNNENMAAHYTQAFSHLAQPSITRYVTAATKLKSWPWPRRQRPCACELSTRTWMSPILGSPSRRRRRRYPNGKQTSKQSDVPLFFSSNVCWDETFPFFADDQTADTRSALRMTLLHGRKAHRCRLPGSRLFRAGSPVLLYTACYILRKYISNVCVYSRTFPFGNIINI